MKRTIILSALLLLTGCGTRKGATEHGRQAHAEAMLGYGREMVGRQMARGKITELRLSLSPPDSSGVQAVASVARIETVFSVEDSIKTEARMNHYVRTEEEEKSKQAEKRRSPFSLLFIIFALLAYWGARRQ